MPAPGEGCCGTGWQVVLAPPDGAGAGSGGNFFWPHLVACVLFVTFVVGDIRGGGWCAGGRLRGIVRSCREAVVLSRVELFERIRRDRRLDPGVSVRELARRHGVHRRTVREALASAVPRERKKPARTRALVLEPAMGWIDAMLREDAAAPRKQRHTMRRIYDRLVVEHGFDQACYSTVCNYVNRRRPEVEAEARQAREGRVIVDGTVPQVHEPGAEAEVDFADVWVRLAGEPARCHMFTLRLSYSGKAVHRIYASQSQEAFMQGHVEAFAVLGGIPVGHIRYDNLRSAVSQVCFGRSRVESQRWVAFRSHYEPVPAGSPGRPDHRLLLAAG